MKFRDFLFVVCLVALAALGLRQASIRSGVTEAVQTPEALEASERQPETPAAFERRVRPDNSRERVDTGFRIKRITASVLADNVSDDEEAAIAGFVRTEVSSAPGRGVAQLGGTRVEDSESRAADQPTTINSEPVSVQELQIDGIHWAVYEEHWLESTLGKADRLGSVDFQGRRYHRWSWPGKRDFILVESASGSGLYPAIMVGKEFSANGSVVLRAGDPPEKAVAVLGEQLRKVWTYGGSRIAVTAQVSEGWVQSVTLEELAPMPKISSMK